MDSSKLTDNTDNLGGVFNTRSLFSNVLLVEDDLAHSQLIKRALKDVVGEVTHVTTAQLAIEALGSSLPELVLSDLLLPDTSGIELLKQIRNVRPGLPVIVMTSSSKIDDAVAAMREGAWDYMIKQFSEDFRERIRIVIERVAERKLQQMRELRVRAERDAFSAAVRSAQDGLAILDVGGNIVFANDAFYGFCARLDSAYIKEKSANVVELVAGRDASVSDELKSHLEGHISGGESLWRSELKGGLDATDESMYFELTLTSFGASGATEGDSFLLGNYKFRRHVVWVKDITSKKEQERFQRDLLAMTSHDLKGPLGAIVTSSELLPNYVPKEEKRAQDLVTHIGSCARNCITMIDELLSARRIQDGVMVITPKVYDVNEIIEEIVLDYSTMAEAKSLELSYHPTGDNDNIDIYVDRLGLHRVLGNLVHNAIKFTPKGGKVKITAQRKGDGASIAVSDTGPGIEPEARLMLFAKYTRLDKHQNVDGTGLGLFVAKSIVDAHEGRIEVTSKIDAGTTFMLSFPDAKMRAENE